MARICIQTIKINTKLVKENEQIKIVLLPTAIANPKVAIAADIINTKAHKMLINLDINKKFVRDLVYDFADEFSIYVFYKSKESVFKLLDYCKIPPIECTNGSRNSKEDAFSVTYFVETEEDTIFVPGEVSEFTFSLNSAQAVRISETWVSGGDEIYFVFEKIDFKTKSALKELTFPHPGGFYKFKKKNVNHTFTTSKITFNKDQYLKITIWEKDRGHKSIWDSDDNLGEFIVNPLIDISNPIINKVEHTNRNGGNYNLFYSVLPIHFIFKKKRGKDGYTMKTLTSITPLPIFQSFFNKMEQLNNRLKGIIQPNPLPSVSIQFPEFKALYKNMLSVAPDKVEDTERINEFIDNYYDEFLNNPELKQKYIEELAHSQYPIMAYPVFPEPAYYYLKKISNKFILPAVEAMPMNSMALFVNNPEFVEAFLCGMNTEMGRELLWREYPTDSRGSYFRKFWDTELKKNIREELNDDTLFDVLPLHQWESAFSGNTQKPHHLGENHTKGKDNLLIFAVKGDLLKKFPDTLIFLSQAKLVGQEIKIDPNGAKLLPDLSAWLSHDTYIVGFPVNLQDITGDPLTMDPGFFLTFMNKPSETRFRNIPAVDRSSMLTETNAAVRSVNELVQPCIFGKHVSQFLTGWTLKK